MLWIFNDNQSYILCLDFIQLRWNFACDNLLPPSKVALSSLEQHGKFLITVLDVKEVSYLAQEWNAISPPTVAGISTQVSLFAVGISSDSDVCVYLCSCP